MCVNGAGSLTVVVVNVMDGQRSGLPSTSADLVQDIDVPMQADRRVSIAQSEIRFFSFSRHHLGHCS
jgi:hypothetical protein